MILICGRIATEQSQLEEAARNWFSWFKLCVPEGIGVLYPSTGMIAIARIGYFDGIAPHFKGFREFIDARPIPGQFRFVAIDRDLPAAHYCIFEIA